MSTFVINGKSYQSKPFTFNVICDLEDLGVDFTSASEKTMKLIRGYLALCGKMSVAEAGDELEAHSINGYGFDDLASAMQTEMEKSDFFRSLNKTTEEETPTRKTSQRKKEA